MIVVFVKNFNHCVRKGDWCRRFSSHQIHFRQAEAVFLVDGAPDSLGIFAGVTCVSLWYQTKIKVVAL